MENRQPVKLNIPLCLAAILLCLTLFSFYLTGGLYARYVAKADGSDSARVAAFSITQDLLNTNGEQQVDITLDAYPDFTKDYTISITNDSEVAVSYVVEIKNHTKNLPLTATLTNKEDAPVPVIVMADETITFAAQQQPGEFTDEYTLRFTWPSGDWDIGLAGMVDHVTVTLTAVQRD